MKRIAITSALVLSAALSQGAHSFAECDESTKTCKYLIDLYAGYTVSWNLVSQTTKATGMTLQYQDGNNQTQVVLDITLAPGAAPNTQEGSFLATHEGKYELVVHNVDRLKPHTASVTSFGGLVSQSHIFAGGNDGDFQNDDVYTTITWYK